MGPVLIATDPTLGDWAALGGAVFTACAAGAALLTTRQGRKLIEASERAIVEAQVLRDPGTGGLRLALINSGRGVARGVNFVVHADGQATENIVNDGFMEPGERVHAVTSIGLVAPAGVMQHDLPDLAVMVTWRDAAGFVHYRTHTEVEHVPRTRLLRRPKYPDRTEVFGKLYPHVAIDAAVKVPNQLQKP
jgi:hypothetical protein